MQATEPSSNAEPPGSADETPLPVPAALLPSAMDLQTFFLGGLFAMAVLTALHVASAVILPIVLAFVLRLLLQRAVDTLERVRVPRSLGAFVIILLAGGLFAGFVAALSVPAASWAQRLPEGVPRLEAHLVVLKRPIEALQHLIEKAELATETPGHTHSIDIRERSGLAGSLLEGTRTIADGLLTTVLVLYFLLVSADTFLRRIVEILPTLSDKRQAVDISRQIDRDLSAYLVTITAMNAAVGAATALAMHLCGLGDPLLWGAAAFLLNYIPFVGPLFGVAIFLLAGLLTFDSLWWATLPPLLYFGIHLVEGEALTPMLIARRFTLNPVLVILSVVFWFWMWGVPGAILAVPLLAILKIICDRLGPLMALGHFLEG